MILDAVTLPMLQWPDEVRQFGIWMRAHDVQHVLEIGTGPGGFTMFLGKTAPGVIVSVDLPNGATSGLSREACWVRNATLLADNPRFVGVIGDSHALDTQQRVAGLLPGQVDLLFIDGDHHYDGIKHDVDAYRCFVRPGGWIAFHDINAHKYAGDGVDVPQYWFELQGDKEEISVGGEWGGIGIWQP